MSELNKELLYEKIITISEAKGKLITENEQLIKENADFKKKIEELEQKVKELESGGASKKSIIEIIEKFSAQFIEEIKDDKPGEE